MCRAGWNAITYKIVWQLICFLLQTEQVLRQLQQQQLKQLKSMYYFDDKTFSDNILSREVRCAGHSLRTELAIIVREIFLNVTISYKSLNL